MGYITDDEWMQARKRVSDALGIYGWVPSVPSPAMDEELAAPYLRLLARYYEGERTPDLYAEMLGCDK